MSGTTPIARWPALVSRVLLISLPLLAADGARAAGIYFSEYVEGSASNKVLEIFNPGPAPVDLADYSVRIHANGATEVSSSVPLSGILAPGAVLLVAHSAADLPVAADLTGNLNFNGDDAVDLFDGTRVLDVVGVIGVDPGNAWTVGDSGTRDATLLRIARSVEPAWDPDQWRALPVDSFADLGRHVAPATVPLPAAGLLMPGAVFMLLRRRRA